MKIAVLGAGHMGAWFIREFSKNHEVAVYDIDKEKAEQLKCAGVLANLSGLRSFRPQLLLNAVTLKHTVAVFEESAPYLPEDCLISDIASIKGSIPAYYNRHPFPFVSLHPMFGPHFADLNRLRNENAIIISESGAEGKAFFTRFFKSYHLRLVEHTFARHDELMAESLALPFSTSIAFAASLAADTVPGTTYVRQKSMAGKVLQEDDSLLCEVLFNPAARQVLDRLTESCQALKKLIENRDYTAAGNLFSQLRNKLDR